MNNAIFITIFDRTGEQYDLSRAAVASAFAQDIPVDIFIIDNGSTCEATKQWLSTLDGCTIFRYVGNESPCLQTNRILAQLFALDYEHALGLPNDVICPPNLYRKLLEWPQGIVTPGMHGTNPPAIMENVNRIHGDCHMSAALIRKSAYDALVAQDGYFFDEETQREERDSSGAITLPQKGFFMYASDCDLKVRLAKAGVPTAQLDILCWHYGGASHRLGLGASAAYRQADIDRDYFARKHGNPIESQYYAEWLAKL